MKAWGSAEWTCSLQSKQTQIINCIKFLPLLLIANLLFCLVGWFVFWFFLCLHPMAPIRRMCHFELLAALFFSLTPHPNTNESRKSFTGFVGFLISFVSRPALKRHRLYSLVIWDLHDMEMDVSRSGDWQWGVQVWEFINPIQLGKMVITDCAKHLPLETLWSCGEFAKFFRCLNKILSHHSWNSLFEWLIISIFRCFSTCTLKLQRMWKHTFRQLKPDSPRRKVLKNQYGPGKSSDHLIASSWVSG